MIETLESCEKKKKNPVGPFYKLRGFKNVFLFIQVECCFSDFKDVLIFGVPINGNVCSVSLGHWPNKISRF